MKHRNNKRIGDLTVRDFVEMCAFLAETEREIAAPPVPPDEKCKFMFVNEDEQPFFNC